MRRPGNKGWTNEERWALIRSVENATFLGCPLVKTSRINDAWAWHKKSLDSRFGRNLKPYSWRRQYLDSVRMLQAEAKPVVAREEINCSLIGRLAAAGRTDFIQAICSRLTLEEFAENVLMEDERDA